MQARIFSFVFFFVFFFVLSTPVLLIRGQSLKSLNSDVYDSLLGPWKLTSYTYNPVSAAEESLFPSVTPVLVIEKIDVSGNSLVMESELTAASTHAVTMKYSIDKDAWKVTTRRLPLIEKGEGSQFRLLQSYIFKVFRQISDVELKNSTHLLVTGKSGSLVFTQAQPVSRNELLLEGEGEHLNKGDEIPPPPPMVDNAFDDMILEEGDVNAHLKRRDRRLHNGTPFAEGNMSPLQTKVQQLRVNKKEAVAGKAGFKNLDVPVVRKSDSIRSFEYATTTLQRRSGESVDGNKLPLTEALRDSTLVFSNIRRRVLAEKTRATLSIVVPVEGTPDDDVDVVVFTARIEYVNRIPTSSLSTVTTRPDFSAIAGAKEHVRLGIENDVSVNAAENSQTTGKTLARKTASLIPVLASTTIDHPVADQEIKFTASVRIANISPRSAKFEHVETVMKFLENVHSIAVVNLPQVTGIPAVENVLAEISLISRSAADEDIVITFLE